MHETAEADRRAIERYRYLLRTAPPDALERAHTEAFAQLTAEQRAQVLRELSETLPESERSSAPAQPDPQALARLATRAELRQPGTMERLFGARPAAMGMSGGMGGLGMGGMFAGTLLSSIAGTFIGTAIAHQFLEGFEDAQDPDAGQAAAGEAETDYAQAQDDASADPGAEDFGSEDFGGDDFDV